MITSPLFHRTARLPSRAGFTLVELLVVIGIIAILAGVALGPITNGIKQAKHNAAMQTGRQIGQMCFSFSTDNVQNGNAYPADVTGVAIAQDLLNANYATDPSVFIVAGQTSSSVATPSGGKFNLVTANCSWSFSCTALTTAGGITSNASDLTPLVYFDNGVGVGIATTLKATPGTPVPETYGAAAPFGTDGTAIFYKGNNANYIKATGTTAGQITTFISANDTDTTTYVVAP